MLHRLRAFVAGSDDAAPVDTGVTVDAAFDVLSSARRRRVIQYLASDDVNTATLAEVTEALAVREYGRDYSSQQRKRVYVSLYQTHIPKLGGLGVIDYAHGDGDGTVRATPVVDALADVIDEVDTRVGGDDDG